jgi:hypothetical protein
MPGPSASTSWISAQTVSCLLVLAIALPVSVRASDPQAVLRDPYHLHLVVGGTVEQRQQALAHHRHSRDGSHTHPAGSRPRHTPGGRSDDVRVFSVAGAASHPAVASVDAPAPAAAARSHVPYVPGSVRLARAATRALPIRPNLPVPEPPPRAL